MGGTWPRWLDLGTANTVTASGTVLSAVLLLIGWELKLRRDSYQQVVNAVAELVVAWERMKLASCISRAVESNLQWALHDDNRELVGDERMKSVRRIGAELRQVAPTRRPITVSALFKLQRRRYRTVKKSNTDLRNLFASQGNFRGQAPLEPPLVDAPALERLTEATGQWEAALALARASMTRWPVLEQLVVQCNTLVRQWWVYAQNDPYYRDPTADAEERLRWFEEAKEFHGRLPRRHRHPDHRPVHLARPAAASGGRPPRPGHPGPAERPRPLTSTGPGRAGPGRSSKEQPRLARSAARARAAPVTCLSATCLSARTPS